MGKHQLVLCIIRLGLVFSHSKLGVSPQECTFPNAIKPLPKRIFICSRCVLLVIILFYSSIYLDNLLINFLRIQGQVSYILQNWLLENQSSVSGFSTTSFTFSNSKLVEMYIIFQYNCKIKFIHSLNIHLLKYFDKTGFRIQW